MASLGTGLPAPAEIPFTQERCQRQAATYLGMGVGRYYVYRTACPTPVVDASGRVVRWDLPDCGKRGTIICDKDIVI